MKPEFWKDGTIASLPVTTRLAYIGLWGLADDAGWLRLDVPAIALELFGYEPRVRREKVVSAAVEDLVAAKRIEVHDCGHALIPRFVDHQRFAGETKRVYTIRREHADCPRTPAGSVGDDAPEHDPAGTRGGPRVPATVSKGKERNVSVRQGSSDARKRDDESESEFRLRVGLPSFMGGGS